MNASKRHSPEVQEWAISVFQEQDEYPTRWAAVHSIAGKIGCREKTLRP